MIDSREDTDDYTDSHVLENIHISYMAHGRKSGKNASVFSLFDESSYNFKYKHRASTIHRSKDHLSSHSWKSPTVVGIQMSASVIVGERWAIYRGAPVTKSITSMMVIMVCSVTKMLPVTVVTRPLPVTLPSPPRLYLVHINLKISTVKDIDQVY